MHTFYDRNGRPYKILFANDNVIRQNMQTNLNSI